MTPQACNQPDVSAPPVRITPSTRRRVLALIPAAGGLLLFAVEAVRYFHHH